MQAACIRMSFRMHGSVCRSSIELTMGFLLQSSTTIYTQPGTSTTSASTANTSREAGGSVMNRSIMSLPQTTPSMRVLEPSTRSSDSFFASGRNLSTSSSPQIYQYAPAQPRNARAESIYSHGTLTPPNQSPHTARRTSPNPARSHERSMSGSFNFAEPSSGFKYDQQPVPGMLQVPASPVTSHDSSTMGRRSPRIDRVPSPGPFSQSVASTLPRNFSPFKNTGKGRKKFQCVSQIFTAGIFYYSIF